MDPPKGEGAAWTPQSASFLKIWGIKGNVEQRGGMVQ